jgi:ferritin-like metal-binding protein YciE
MATTSSSELIKRYLQDAIASERAFESQLRSMAGEGDNPLIRELFANHADETKSQCNRLTSRLQVLGGSPSTAKGIVAHIFGALPKAGQIGQKEEDKNTHNLIVAYAIEQSEVASYEALKVAAEAVGDIPTANLVEEIQREEQMTAQRIWNLIPANARLSVDLQASGERGKPRRGDVSGIAGSPL